jgi:hypothetical protein
VRGRIGFLARRTGTNRPPASARSCPLPDRVRPAPRLEARHLASLSLGARPGLGRSQRRAIPSACNDGPSRTRPAVPSPPAAPRRPVHPFKMDQLANAEVLYEVKAIAKFLGLPKRAAQHQVDTGRIPHFRMGKNICARPSSLAPGSPNSSKQAPRTRHLRTQKSDRSTSTSA